MHKLISEKYRIQTKAGKVELEVAAGTKIVGIVKGDARDSSLTVLTVRHTSKETQRKIKLKLLLVHAMYPYQTETVPYIYESWVVQLDGMQDPWLTICRIR